MSCLFLVQNYLNAQIFRYFLIIIGIHLHTDTIEGNGKVQLYCVPSLLFSVRLLSINIPSNIHQYLLEKSADVCFIECFSW